MSSLVYLLIPCFNEGKSIIRLLEEIDAIVDISDVDLRILIIDDHSTDDTLQKVKMYSSPRKISIISLPVNIGHQGAIAQGILFASAMNPSQIIIMDGDGEDDPAAIDALLAKRQSADIIHVVRGRRREQVTFRIAYWMYRLLFKMVTGRKMNIGNFCMISQRVINVLTQKRFIHLASFLLKLSFTSSLITFDRRRRIDGNSKMNFSALMHHALRSFIEFADAVLMLFLKLFLILFTLFVLTIVYILYLRFFTDMPIVGWTSTFGIGLLTGSLLCLGFFTLGIVLLNHSAMRNSDAPAPRFAIIRD